MFISTHHTIQQLLGDQHVFKLPSDQLQEEEDTFNLPHDDFNW